MTMPLPAPALPGPAATPQAPAPTDAELAARARRGDGPAFELIMRRHNRRLFRLARSLVRSDAEAEDVLQEAYLRAYARVVSLEEHRTRAGREEDGLADEPASDQPDPERLAASGELRRLLEA